MQTSTVNDSSHLDLENTIIKKKVTHPTAYAVLCSLFFLWGLPNILQGIIMPQFQIGFQLSNLQTGILDFSFYIGLLELAYELEGMTQSWVNKLQIF